MAAGVRHSTAVGDFPECIRRDHGGEIRSLSGVLARHSDFFSAFEDFPGYVEFRLLQDLVNDDSSAIRFFTPFDDFRTRAMST